MFINDAIKKFEPEGSGKYYFLDFLLNFYLENKNKL